jgi:hypothetical protein
LCTAMLEMAVGPSTFDIAPACWNLCEEEVMEALENCGTWTAGASPNEHMSCRYSVEEGETIYCENLIRITRTA